MAGLFADPHRTILGQSWYKKCPKMIRDCIVGYKCSSSSNSVHDKLQRTDTQLIAQHLRFIGKNQGSLNYCTYIGGIKQYTCMVILSDLPLRLHCLGRQHSHPWTCHGEISVWGIRSSNNPTFQTRWIVKWFTKMICAEKLATCLTFQGDIYKSVQPINLNPQALKAPCC